MFFENIEKLCAKKGISITKLSEVLNLSSSVVTGWKNGAQPRKSTLKKIAEYFDVSIDYLFENKQTNQYNKYDLNDLPPDVIENINQYIEFLRAKHKK
jgi:transcriptional regulator with XRE-family HTH domain